METVSGPRVKQLALSFNVLSPLAALRGQNTHTKAFSQRSCEGKQLEYWWLRVDGALRADANKQNHANQDNYCTINCTLCASVSVTILVIPTSDFSVIYNFKSLNYEPEQSKSASPQRWSGAWEGEMEHNRSLWDLPTSWVFCCHQLFYQIHIYVTNTQPKKKSSHSTVKSLKQNESVARATALWCCRPSLSPLIVVFDTASFLLFFCLWSTHETRSEGSREWGSTFAACDVGIAHCLFEAIWSRHMWENLVLVLNVSLWRASRFVRDNITVQSYRGA